MMRFYSFQLDSDLKILNLTDLGEIHHMKHVLRLKVGDTVEIFNGGGLEAEGQIDSISEKEIAIKLIKFKTLIKNSPRLILACAIPKKSKFETIIEKATELGVDEIIPLITQRTEVVLKEEERLLKKIERFQTVALNASKQSKRTTIPIIHAPIKFKDCLMLLKKRSVLLMPSLEDKRSNLIDEFKIIGRPDCVTFLIGPEGDFTKQEYALAFEEGCIGVSLGPTVLKVETAALCALSCANVYYFS